MQVPAIYHTWGKHDNHYSTDTVKFIACLFDGG